MNECEKICEICSSCFFVQKNSTKRTCSKECSYKLRTRERFSSKNDVVEKTCSICHELFFDKSKRKTSIKCIKCSRKEGVETRQRKGSYKRTDEQNKKMSLTFQLLRSQGKAKISDDAREKMSKEFSERWKSDEFREKVKKGYTAKYGVDHYMKSDFAKSKFSALYKGRKLEESALLKMRQSAAKRIKEGRHRVSYFGKGGVRSDIGFYVRSRWEANFARYLIFTKQDFQYEPDSFLLSTGRTYTPDFKVGDMYFEVKGWWTSTAKEKFELFTTEFPHIYVKIIDYAEYRQIESQYSNLIECWEKKNDLRVETP